MYYSMVPWSWGDPFLVCSWDTAAQPNVPKIQEAQETQNKKKQVYPAKSRSANAGRWLGLVSDPGMKVPSLQERCRRFPNSRLIRQHRDCRERELCWRARKVAEVRSLHKVFEVLSVALDVLCSTILRWWMTNSRGSDDWSAMAGEMDDVCSRERRAEIERLWRVHVLDRF
jgi:hypothetical protein